MDFADWPQRIRRVGIACALCCVAFPPFASAQVGVIGGNDAPALTPPPVVVDRDDPFAKPSRDYQALPIGGWMLYPSLFVGGLYDSNPSQSPGKGSGSFASSGSTTTRSTLRFLRTAAGSAGGISSR
jgi:hypothetical protein